MKRIIYFASGCTSNFVMTTFKTNLVNYINQDIDVYASVRNSDSIESNILKASGIRMISTQDSLHDNFKPYRILWFSSHSDPDLLALYAKKAPTLLISSGAIMNYYLNPDSDNVGGNLSDYAYGKFAMSKVPGVHIFVPGFLIEDIGFTQNNKSGLHSESTKIIFGNDNGNAKTYLQTYCDYDWGRAYSVTPKSFLQTAIVRWIDDPDSMPIEQPIIVCSDRVYRRYELRELAGYEMPRETGFTVRGLHLPMQDNKLYEHFYHIPDSVLIDADIKRACEMAREPFQSKL